MKELVILSGKGGTGKTSLAAALCNLAGKMVLCDADVDAADLHLLMSPEIKQQTDFKGGGIAVINPEQCTQCGLCQELCRFNAVKDNFTVDAIACEGCGVCVDLCPEKAITFPIQICGQWFLSETRFGPMVHASLGIAEENSGKLVALVRQEAKKMAEAKKMDLIITDGPPGIGCPVIASMGGATLLLIVTEPTVSGIHDMQRVMELATHFKVPAMVCVNKYDLNPEQTQAIEQIVKKQDLTLAGRIPYDPVFTKAMVAGRTIFEYGKETDTHQAVRNIMKTIFKTIQRS